MMVTNFHSALVAFVLMLGMRTATAAWTVETKSHDTQVGNVLDIKNAGVRVAQFVFQGGAPAKPHMNVFGVDGEILTQDEPTANFPHHRGMYVGWDEVISGLGSHDLWHMDTGRMSTAEVENVLIREDGVTLKIRIEWWATLAVPGDLLLTEWRTMKIRQSGGETLVDMHCCLQAERALTLDGDLQHAGIHYRAHDEVHDRSNETTFLEAPEGTVAGNNLKWCQMMFGRGARRYAVTLFNAPGNPVEELSQRTYGRFGYFFSHSLALKEKLAVNYRYRVVEAELPDTGVNGTVFEAEDAALVGAPIVDNSNLGFTGTGYVDFTTASGQFIEWTVNTVAAGNQDVSFRYALSSGNRPLELMVNGAVVEAAVSFPATGGFSNYDVVQRTLNLNLGANTIRLTTTGSSGANIDHLSFDTPGDSEPDGGIQASRATNEQGYTDFIAWLQTDLDSDVDEMPDSWETSFFGNLSRDGTEDKDKDGVNDRNEFLAGTDPNDNSVWLRVKSIKEVAGNVELRWDSVLGRNYQVLHSSDLTDPWMPRNEMIAGTGGEMLFSETMPIEKGFYVVRVSLP